MDFWRLIREDLSHDGASPPDNETLRGILSIRQLSLLRTQLKADLAILGDVYTGKLSKHEREFLIGCNFSLDWPPWRSATERGVGLESTQHVAEEHKLRILPEIQPNRQIVDD